MCCQCPILRNSTLVCFCHNSDMAKSLASVLQLNDLTRKKCGGGGGSCGGRCGGMLVHKIQRFYMNLASSNWTVSYCGVKMVNQPLDCTTSLTNLSWMWWNSIASMTSGSWRRERQWLHCCAIPSPSTSWCQMMLQVMGAGFVHLLIV